MCRVRSDDTIEEVWSSPEPIIPVAYAHTRSTAAWEAVAEDLHRRWKGHWSNTGTAPGGPS